MTQLERSPNLPKYAKDVDRPYVGDPWVKQPGESAKCYEAFVIYCELDPDKRTKALALQTYADRNGLKRASNSWPSKHRWSERVEAYDAYLAGKKRRALERRALKAAEKHADQAAAALEVATAPSMKLAERLRKQREENDGLDFLDNLDDEQLVRLHKVMVGDVAGLQKAEREALTAANGTSDTGPDTKKLKMKGQRLMKILARPDMIEMAERVQIEMSAEEAAEDEATG